MKEVVRVGYIGLGRRGMAMLKDCFAQMKDVHVAAVCDVSQTKNEAAIALLQEMGRPAPNAYTDYRKLLKEEKHRCHGGGVVYRHRSGLRL